MEGELHEAVASELHAFAAGRAPDGADLALVFENIGDGELAPRDAALFIKVNTMPVTPERLHCESGGAARYVWLLSLVLHVRAGTGMDRALALLDALREHFPEDHRFLGAHYAYRITSPLSISAAVPSPGWHALPARLRLEAIT